MKNISSKIARYVALLNASEFIRQHGEEGGFEENDFTNYSEKEYNREKEKIAKMLDKMATDYKSKYHL